MSKNIAVTNNVKHLKKTKVKPQKPIGKKECQLVPFDLPYLTFYYNQKLMIYKGAEKFEEYVKRLKDGLALVLQDFYQLAGKLREVDERVYKVEYDDGMDGVEVIVAEAKGIGLQDFTDKAGITKFQDLIPCNKILNREGLRSPLLAVQLTKLKDGLSMGLAFNHAVLDDTSTWHFMTSWAQLCRRPNSAIETRPFLDRTKAPKLPKPSDAPEHSKSATKGNVATSVDPPLRDRVFKFSDSAIDEIKSKVNATLPPGGSLNAFTTFQSLSAHVWLAVTRARELKPKDCIFYRVFVDCRRRVFPGTQEIYFGNLIQAIVIETTKERLMASSIEAAGMIQQAIVKHDARAIEERNKEWESSPKFPFKDFGVNFVAVENSPRFKVYEVDFGWGKPEIVRSGLNNRFDGMVYLYPAKNGGKGIDMEITLEANAMERLEKDKEFLKE